MINHFIFDLDGTLLDSYPVFTDIAEIMLQNHGISDTRESLYAKLKVSLKDMIEAYDFGTPYADMLEEFHRIHNELYVNQKPFPDTLRTLKELRAAGRKTYVYTHTGALVYKILSNVGLDDEFDYVIDNSLGFPAKPDPSALNFLLQKCDIPRDEALMIGDRSIDVLAGKNAGIKGCLIDPEGYYKNFITDYRIDTLYELAELFL